MADFWLDDGLEDAFTHFDVEEADTAPAQKEPVRVHRIKYNSITPERFETEFSAVNKPAILGDAFAPIGPVPPEFDLKFWKENYGSEIVPLDVGTPDEKVVKLGDFLAFSDKELSKGYCRSLHTAEWFPEVNRKLQFPRNLISETNFLTLKGEPGYPFPEAWGRWFEIFISNRDSAGFPFLHIDMCATHAFSMQVQGIKRFYLFPPSDTPYLYAYGNTGTRSAIPHRDLVSSSVSLERFPLFQHATPYIADLRPGDVFFCPSGWWHTTVVKSAEPSITFGGNYVDNSNHDEFNARWREYVTMQKLVASGITRIEHGGKAPNDARASRQTSSS